MPIPAPETLTVLPVAEKVYPHQWIYNLLVHAPTTSSGRITIELLPFNGSTGEIGPSASLETVSTERLFECFTEVPEAYAAYTAVLAAVEPIRQWLAAQAAAQANQDPV